MLHLLKLALLFVGRSLDLNLRRAIVDHCQNNSKSLAPTRGTTMAEKISVTSLPEQGHCDNVSFEETQDFWSEWV